MVRFLFILSAFLCIPATGIPANLFVPTQYPSIQEAINASVSGDNVIVAPGVYSENIDFLGKDIRVISTHGANVTAIDGMGSDVVTFQTGESSLAILEGFTITNGNRGIRIDNQSDATVTACMVTDCTNSGIYCTNLSPASINHCVIFENNGSGIYLEKGSDSILSNNLIWDNSAVKGGGIFCRNSSPIITSCTIASNSAVSSGGIQFIANTINIHPIITNTILWGNDAPLDPEIGISETSGTVNLTMTFCDIKGGWSGFGNININPLFLNPSSGNFRLYYSSPCVDKGTNSAPYMGSKDLDGVSRTIDGDGDGSVLVDIGCYEFKPLLVPVDYPSIQSAINDADNVGAVFVDPGTYAENIDFLGKKLLVKSLQGSGVTIIDGNQMGSVVTFQSGEGELSVLKGFTITNGSGVVLGGSTTNGGGVLCDATSPTLIMNEIIDNTVSGNGAGIYLRDGASPIISSCTLDGNSAANLGGGIFCRAGSDAIISNNVISGNIGGNFGGGIYCWESSPTIVANTISDNQAHYGGGIQCNYLSAPKIDRNTISNNMADNGGGIYGYQDSAVITNNIIVYNTATADGGGIRVFQSSAMITGNTLSENTAANGGAFECQGFTGTLINSILWNNTATSSGPEILVTSGALDVTYCDVMGGWPGTGNIDVDPLFLDPNAPVDPDFHISSDSPCIDAGYNNAPALPKMDMDGEPRIAFGGAGNIISLSTPFYRGVVDMGADEFNNLKHQGF